MELYNDMNTKESKQHLEKIEPSKKVDTSMSTEITSTNQEIGQSVQQTLNSVEQIESAEEKLKGYQILHIDDEEMILKILKRVFSKKVLKTNSFTNSKDLLQALEAADIPTIVISDNNFEPGITGLELAEKTYEFRKAKNIPFIIFCADYKEDIQIRIKKLLENHILDGYIEKPATPSDMTNAVLKAIK